ncbi:hypothetical protein D7316_00033 [Gordonia insulae]|uniref:Uncharacterized protein n=1 Tax=Gordonia insulae TaxID=2420509 RepID=A0A3G8JEY3_9ACTN|nr:hypothetical protein D7316_00033 [Gordonia insulae]
MIFPHLATQSRDRLDRWLCGHGIHHYNRYRRMPYGVTYRACICGRLHPHDAGRLT